MSNRVMLSVLFSLVLLSPLMAQREVYPGKFWVSFTDKKQNAFSVNRPEEFLSQRAISRRERFQIPITTADLPVSRVYLDSIESLGFKILNVSKWLNGALITESGGAKIDQLKSLSFVAQGAVKPTASPEPYVKRNAALSRDMIDAPVEGFLTYTPGYINTRQYGYAANQIVMLRGHYLHAAGYKGQGMVVAVLDGGFYHTDRLPAFDSLWADGRLLGTWDFVEGKPIDFELPATHGMQVLSTMAANIPGEFVGTAPLASYWLLRSEDTQTEYLIEEYNWVCAAEFADSVGADVINSSLGYSNFDNELTSYSYAHMDGNTAVSTIGADLAASRGILVVTSAGNSGNDSWKYITAPADADSILTVGAVNSEGRYAYFSSRGPTVDQRVKPNVCSQGVSSVVQGQSGSISTSDGTSFASPIMAGMVTCLWQAHPKLNNMDIIETLQLCGSIYNKPDTYLGYGIPDFALAHHYLTLVAPDKELSQNKVLVYPNPFNTHISVEILENYGSEVSVDLTGISGQMVFEKTFVFEDAVNYKYMEISELSNLPRGIYLLKIVNSSAVHTYKLIRA